MEARSIALGDWGREGMIYALEQDEKWSIGIYHPDTGQTEELGVVGGFGHATLSPDENSEDNVHVVWWKEFSPETSDILYIKKESPPQPTPTPVNVSHSSGASRTPDIAIDNTDTIHVVWNENTYDAYYSYSQDGGVTWSPPVNVTCGYGYGAPTIGVDNNTGHIYVSTTSHYFVIEDKDDAECRPPQTVPEAPTWGLRMAVDGGGAVHFVGFAPAWDWAIAYRKLDPESGWTTPVALSQLESDLSRIAVEDNGRAHAVWIEAEAGQPGKKVHYARGVNDSWEPSDKLSDDSEAR